nr:DUF2304 family protein [uncultured Dorea sp.]
MLSTAVIMKIGLIIVGVMIMIMSFVFHAKRKLTVNLAVVWEFLGFALILIGAVPVFSSWCHLLARGTVIAMFVVGALALWGSYILCILISNLSMKNQELAMQVSLLNQENELMLKEIEKLKEDRENDR